MGDTNWLGLRERAAGQYSVELDATHARFDGQFYGGAGLAIFTAALSRRTGRHPLWVTAQFISSASMGEIVDCEVEMLAEGRASTQARMTATVGDRLLLAGLGSAGIDRPDALAGNFGGMPVVRPPEDSEPWTFLRQGHTETERFGPMLTAEFRRARSETGITRLWVRMAGEAQSAASLAYLADIVPAGVVRAAGRAGAGVSLDNSIRFGPPPDTDWVLLEVDPYFAHSGFVHGAARVWSPEGILLAVASQTARALLFD